MEQEVFQLISGAQPCVVVQNNLCVCQAALRDSDKELVSQPNVAAVEMQTSVPRSRRNQTMWKFGQLKTPSDAVGQSCWLRLNGVAFLWTLLRAKRPRLAAKELATNNERGKQWKSNLPKTEVKLLRLPSLLITKLFMLIYSFPSLRSPNRDSRPSN